jgi:hypothetical protein
VGALDDPQALVLGHGRHHRHEAAPHRRFEVDIAAVENPDRGSGIDHGLDDLQAVPHRARRPVPFGNHKLVAGVEVFERAGAVQPSAPESPAPFQKSEEVPIPCCGRFNSLFIANRFPVRDDLIPCCVAQGISAAHLANY